MSSRVTAAVLMATAMPLAARTQAPVAKPFAIATDKQMRGTVDVERVRLWVAAARTHSAVQRDTAAASIDDWPPEALAVTLTDVVALTKIARFMDAVRTAAGSPIVLYRERTFALTTEARADARAADIIVVDELLGLTADQPRIAQIDHLLRLGAMLHTDLGTRDEASSEDVAKAASLDAQHPKRMGMLDGHVVSIIDNSDHWQYARFLLDGVDPQSPSAALAHWEDVATNPAHDAFVARWYRATVAWMQSQGRWADADPQMKHGLEIFHDDARLWFYSGVMHEIFAEPQIQQAAQEMIRSGFVQQVTAETNELDLARDDLRRAVVLDPTFAEGHLHLGHVLGRQGSHQDAIDELMVAATTIDGSELQYDARMLLAHEQEATGDQVSAQANLERAAALFPRAQSPRLALSELLHRNDPRAAQVPIDALLSLPSDESARVDPWWNYTRSHVRDAAAKMDDIWRQLRAEAAR